MVAYSGAMANPEHLSILKQGVEVWNHWRAENPDLIPNLSGNLNRRTDLCSLNLCRFNFLRAYLHWVNFADADLTNASFDAAWLTGSNFQGARLKEASFIYAHLIGANFQNADLTEGELTRANCNGADFRGARLNSVVLNETILTDVKFADCTGLDSCQHQGPGRIDYNAIIKSGPLPLIFLQGCGIPDQFINYLPSLLNQSIQFYSCFISHSTKDKDFAYRLHADLQAEGVRCWFAPHDIQGGKKIHEQIDEAIRLYDRLLLILSEHSMASEWVKTEIANARQREVRENRQMLFPISLVPFERLKEWKAFDADTGKDSARDIRAYFIPDFSNWKDQDSYQQAFQRLLRDLKAEGGTGGSGR